MTRRYRPRPGAETARRGCLLGALRLGLAALLLALGGAALANAQAVVLQQTFDGVTAPVLPPGWVDGAGWLTSTTSASTGSGLNNLVNTGTGADNVVSESFSLASVSGATLTYLARRTSSYAAEALVVTASIDGGATFPHVVAASGSALPMATSTWEIVSATMPAGALGQADVRLRFEAAGGTSSSASIRIDDVTVTSGSGGSGGSGGGSGSTLGFPAAASSVASGTTDFEVPVALVHAGATGLQGLQFAVSWTDDVLTFDSVQPGAALANLADWSVSVAAGVRSVTVLVISPNGASLPGGTHDPLLRLRFDVGSLGAAASREVMITVSGPVASLATATGTDAGLVLAQAGHSVTVRSARGDADADFAVDVADLLVGIDVALGRVTASATALSSLDQYPFPVGDGSVDVRDLTVLVQAILAGQWPDGAPLPVPPAGKGWAAAGGLRMALEAEAGGTGRLVLHHDRPLRGVQLDVFGPGVAGARAVEVAGKVSPRVGPLADGLRLLWAAFDGSLLEPGATVLLETTAPGEVRLGRAIAVGVDGARYGVTLAEVPSAARLEAPYPNPFRPAAGEVLRLAGVATEGIEILDALGRRVARMPASGGDATWDGTDAAGRTVGPGLYLARVVGARGTDARTVVVTR